MSMFELICNEMYCDNVWMVWPLTAFIYVAWALPHEYLGLQRPAFPELPAHSIFKLQDLNLGFRTSHGALSCVFVRSQNILVVCPQALVTGRSSL